MRFDYGKFWKFCYFGSVRELWKSLSRKELVSFGFRKGLFMGGWRMDGRKNKGREIIGDIVVVI